MSFYGIILRSNITNTYKMAWARALVDISCDLDNLDENDVLITVELKRIAERFLNYYWNHSF